MTPSVIDKLAHYPTVPSRYVEDDKDDSEEIAEESDEGKGSETGKETAVRHARLRQIKRMNYISTALPRAVSTDDEPKLREALQSAEGPIRLRPVKEAFSGLLHAGTWDDRRPPPINAKVFTSGFLHRIQKDEYGLPKRFKARLIARGNFQNQSFRTT